MQQDILINWSPQETRVAVVETGGNSKLIYYEKELIIELFFYALYSGVINNLKLHHLCPALFLKKSITKIKQSDFYLIVKVRIIFVLQLFSI